ncbi:hypothetical protein PL9214640499 [Planktothrix tepida PCC 9214]|uniref:Uncharacterized protein n=1 Tax=Planktothrix tepida PCC 9214 TaxID=671072 RepID=A0A1J1LRL5_9CYAN|nr:hypothetical protein PL9214640499 [Planktothrix tepida PCC 9214]
MVKSNQACLNVGNVTLKGRSTPESMVRITEPQQVEYPIPKG